MGPPPSPQSSPLRTWVCEPLVVGGVEESPSGLILICLSAWRSARVSYVSKPDSKEARAAVINERGR
jgi:hypothetical protein